ncbi:hypothetical protein BU15DRAFT_70832 [Melanogaster broomeanus]|nr:hypothetical protein BU15DRAFT_70832 [Melanogaster broomeanus]
MSSRGWFTKRVHPPGPKSTKDITCSISTEKLPLHVDGNKSPGSFKFNTFAAVMGKKSKKPSVAFHDRSSPPIPPNSSMSERSNSTRYSNRPPATSVSSTVRSGDDSNGPLTPCDVSKDRMSFPRSVFTLSDSDPFAAGSISLSQEISDSNRTSVFSNSSANDGFLKKTESILPFRRSSFASTSSQSHGNSQSTKLQSASDAPRGSMSGWDCIPRPTLSKCSSTVTLTDKKSPEPPLVPRPPSRLRGYTESSSAQKPPAVSYQSRKSSTPPNGEPSPISPFPRGIAPSLSRKASASRLATQPPRAPPLHDLPPPPVLATASHDTEHHGPSPSMSPSASSISFASSPSTKDLDDGYPTLRYRPLKDERDGSGFNRGSGETIKPHPPTEPLHNPLADIFCQHPTSAARAPTASSGHTLKKSMSHSTLQKPKFPNELSPPPPSSSQPKSVDRELKKQRSFHQSRLQTPSVPQLRHSNSATASNASSSDTNLPTEPRRPVTNSPPVSVRRRLFSGSSVRRPSMGAAEDDQGSVFSLPMEAERTQGMTSLHARSLLDEDNPESIPSSAIAPAPDYAQQIMSPAEMLKVEAVVQSEFDSKYGELLRNRQRNISYTSMSTPHFNAMYVKDSPCTAPTSFPRFSSRTPSTSSWAPSVARPSTVDAPYSPSSLLSDPPGSPTAGLPPPPRSRARPHTTETTYSDVSGRRLSNIPVNPLSPPPRKRYTRASVNADTPPHRAMMRKPSFLEITDEAPPSPYEGSFLDFGSGKESLDLSRDDDITVGS